MKNLILFALFFIIVFYFMDLKVFDNSKNEDGDWDNKAALGSCEFRLEFVSDDDSRQVGLSNRDSLCDECGMLFEFEDKNIRTFWMKDMRFDIDIIWLEDDKVFSVEKNVSRDLEGVISSPDSINRVLEINAGKSEECDINKDSALKYVN